ncbi:MAG: prolipoprotein diacylglyceryl transferase [Verrucomicrobia bacterium]|nr:prolipoprotein diacylglyceryl transferase [Verrucomicrobiota bacterium]
MHKIAFEFGSVAVHWYGVLVATGFLAGLWTASRRGVREGLSPETIVDLGPWIIVGAIVGARGLYVLSYWREDFAGRSWLAILNLRQGGLVYYGGLIGGSLGCIAFTRWKQLPLWKIADVLAPSISLGQAFGRLGCLMTGCCYGRACSLPWAIHFPADHETHGRGVHPTQIYESLLSFSLYAALAWLHRRKQFDGQVFATYLIAYAILRSLVESFRGDYPVYYGGFATPAHLVSVGILLGGLILFWRRRAVPRAGVT